MRTCIICRKELSIESFSDEHVIPDSIGGCYHIDTVCKKCNSNLGIYVDVTLVKHPFITFKRFSLNISGKKGKIPNPFAGTHSLSDDPNQKVTTIFDDKNQLITKFVPRILPSSEKKNEISWRIDISDKDKIPSITDKFIKRNNLDPSKVKTFIGEPQASRPEIEMKLDIDLKDFKLGLLKIAYEFAIDTIEEYFHDSTALIISEFLYNHDIIGAENANIFLTDGFSQDNFGYLDNVIDFKNDNHYLILQTVPLFGLICFVNIFESFFLAIKLSDSFQYTNDNIIIGINDTKKRVFKKLRDKEIYSHVAEKSTITYRFAYYFNSHEESIAFQKIERDSNFYYYDKQLVLFNKEGAIVYSNITQKLNQLYMDCMNTFDEEGNFHSFYNLDEELYIKLMPSMKLYQIVRVQCIMSNFQKL